MNTFDIMYKLFSTSNNSKLDIESKLELFYQDFTIVPLMVYENYLRISPTASNFKIKPGQKNNSKNIMMRPHLQALSNAVNSLSISDIMDNAIHKDQEWSLLPVYGIFSSVIPTYEVAKFPKGQILFTR